MSKMDLGAVGFFTSAFVVFCSFVGAFVAMPIDPFAVGAAEMTTAAPVVATATATPPAFSPEDCGLVEEYFAMVDPLIERAEGQLDGYMADEFFPSGASAIASSTVSELNRLPNKFVPAWAGDIKTLVDDALHTYHTAASVGAFQSANSIPDWESINAAVGRARESLESYKSKRSEILSRCE